MSRRPSPFDCDVCGTIKNVANRWYVALQGGLQLPGEFPDIVEGLAFVPWDDFVEARGDLDGEGVTHLCSEQCCVTLFSRWANKT